MHSSSSSCADYDGAWAAVADAAGLQFKPLDKKLEKALLAAHKEKMQEVRTRLLPAAFWHRIDDVSAFEPFAAMAASAGSAPFTTRRPLPPPVCLITPSCAQQKTEAAFFNTCILQRHDHPAMPRYFPQAFDLEASPAAALSLAVLLLAARSAHRVLSLPGKALQPVLQRLRSQLSPEAFETVAAFHSGVVEYLKAPAGDAQRAAGDALVAQLPALRQAVGFCLAAV